mmetsp:Transcript_2060/g.4670  ORF Transcript_2060/g.4670 Transcript_2060/m.4670 type:complete len:220 (+) Transcript_2060:108-767(+)
MLRHATLIGRQGRVFTHSAWKRSHSIRKHNTNSSLLSWYKRKLDSNPLLTKGITSGAISAAGDGICQYLSVPASAVTFDWLRNIRFFVMGSLFVAPCTHFWYSFLNVRLFPGPSSFVTVSKRVIVDQFGFAVLFQPSFMGILWFMEGRNGIPEQLVQVIPSVLVANWSLWIPAMSVNFAYVPVKFQVLFGNVVALLWNTYLSYKSALSNRTPPIPRLVE